MPIFIVYLIIALATIAITYKTYMGYGEYPLYLKIAFLLFLIIGWAAPMIGLYLHTLDIQGKAIYIIKVLYFIFGFVFFLFMISFIRDTIWMLIDLIFRIPLENMKDSQLLNKVNIITFAFCFLFCIYGVYEAEKNPQIKTYDIVSPKIKEPVKMVMLSDLHIDIDTSLSTIKSIVDRVNAQNPDVIVIVGDVIDNTPLRLEAKMQELQKLKAKDKVYVVLGNHEFYVGAMDWIITFAKMGFVPLNNTGKKVGNTGVYIAGIPDVNAAKQSGMKINPVSTMYSSTPENYVVLLSHTPKLEDGFHKHNTDLMLSGHTHGGQIYPFHYAAKKANKGALAGFYDREGIKLYVSRGTRYWGPPMRIFAPSEITVFNLIPEVK